MGKGSRLRKERQQLRQAVAENLRTGPGRKAMNKEISAHLRDSRQWFLENEIYCMMWALHREFGFGAGRLRRFARRYKAAWTELRDYYDVGDLDTPYMAKVQLAKIGVDLAAWEREEQAESQTS
jgi:hypothetical protein